MRPFVEWVKDPDHGFIISRHWDPVDGWQGAGRLELFDIQERVLAHCLTPVPGEKRFPYTTAIYSCCKKSGKTTTGAAVAVWYGEESPEGSEIYLLANDIDQTLRAYGFVTYHLRKHGYKPQKYFFEFPNGTYIQGLAQEYRSAAGANPGLTLWDELWGYISESSRRLWAEMTPPPTVPFPLRFIVTYAGFEEESELLYDLYKKTVMEGEPVPELIDIEDKQGKPVCWRSKDHTVFAYWDHEPRMPWQTEDYYREQMATLRPMDYLRLHKNRWVTSQEAFMPVDLWDAAVERGKEVELVSPLLYGTHKFKRYPVYVAVDIGTKHDASAVVGCYYDYTRGRVGVAFHKIWVPEPGEGLDLETTVELYIQQVVRGMPNVVLVACDPSQFHRSKITLQKKGIKVEEFAQSNKNLTLATENLYDLLRNGILEAYPADDLRDHLKYAVVEHTNSGYRLSKEKHAKYKIDGAVALACAAYFAVASGGVDTKREIIVRSRSSDFTAMPLPSEQAAIEATLPEAMKTEPTWRRVL